ncbi:hypothetical protein HGO38_01550 [Rhizobium sp. CG5]|uniref:phage tail protein n=1 Tax=Rhizobium sp. CG5 TaxID=2726076 RepID=UPI00203334D4|nr:phage tail protein [Rhizobium sp. CG5]MCM2472161.1 hypothetical protein [Rhizobium sp. CG5]
MNLKKYLICSTAFFLAGATTASAGPLAAAIPAIFGLTGFAAGVVQVLVGLAISYGVTLIQQAQADDTTQQSGVTVTTQFGDDQPVTAILGRYATAGVRAYAGTWGAAGKTPNAYLVDVVELGNLPVTGLGDVWINDSKVTLLTAEEHADMGFPVEEFREDGKDYLWVKFYDGTQTTADAYLTTRFGDDEDRPFEADMVGFGCPYAIITARYNTELHSSAPSCLFEMDGIPLYDIRKDSTNGGSGAHRWNNKATWEHSDNPIVQIYNIARGITYDGVWFYGGQNLPVFRLPSSAWIAAANECDTDISLSGGGTEPRFRSGYQISGDEKPLDAIKKIAKSANARLAEVGGIFKPLVGSPGSAIYAFTDDDILITEGQSFDPFPTLDDTVNGIEATYPEPRERWAMKDAPARYNSTLESEDGDRRLPASVTFEACPYSKQVQRLMRAMLEEARRFRTHQFYLPPDAYALEPNDVVSWSSARNGYSNKKFLVTPITGQITMNQLVVLKEIDPSDYGWSSDFELPTSYGWTGTIVSPPQGVTGWTVAPATIYDASGNPRRPTIQISCASDQDDVKKVRVRVRLASSGDVVFDSDSIVYGDPYSWKLNGTFLPNADYEVQGKFIPYSNRRTTWSSWLSVTTPNVRLTDEDVFVDVDLSGLDELIEDATDWIRGGVREAIETAREAISALTDADSGAFLDRQELRRELVSRSGEITASYTEAITAATGPTSALVGRVESLEATIPSLATVTVVSAIAARVTTTEGNITAYGVRLDDIEATIPGLATASAVSTLSAQVTLIDGEVSTLADAITSVTAGSVDGNVATANFRMTAEGSPGSGYAARIGMEVRSGGSGTWRGASLFLDVPTSTSGLSRIVMMADQVIMTNSEGTLRRPFTYSGGVLYLDNVRANNLASISADLGTVTAGRIESTDGTTLVIDLDDGTIVISS